MVTRSELVDVRPFRTGLIVRLARACCSRSAPTTAGWSVARSNARASAASSARPARDPARRHRRSSPASLLLTGASIGALLRRRTASSRARPALRGAARAHAPSRPARSPAARARRRTSRRSTRLHAYPDVVGRAAAARSTRASELEQTPRSRTSVFEDGLRDRVARRLPAARPRAAAPLAARPSAARAEADGADRRGARLSARQLRRRGDVVGQISGPRVTRYELQLAPGTKVSKVAALKDDLSLRARDDRDPHPRADPGQAGGRRRGPEPRARTSSRSATSTTTCPQTASPLSVWLGKDISGNAVWTDLARMPHLLIAGTTGSGKSGCINTILTSILLRATPDEVRMILIDPKRIELDYYESIPHLLTPVVSSPKEASGGADQRRRRDGAPLRAPRASSARATCPRRTARSASAGEQTLPYLLVVIDELADLMMIAPAGRSRTRSSGSRRSRAPSASTSCSRRSARRWT